MNLGLNSISSRWRTGATKTALAAGAALAMLGSVPAQAQDLVHRFIDPSFGGNPFYSDHLLATALIDRPKQPTTPTTTPTDEELIAQQLRARLLSQLQGNILDSIQNAQVGDSGNFTLGNQTISFNRTGTETRVTFTNTTTGEVNTVVIPAAGTSGSDATGSAASAQATRAAVAASSSNIAVTGSLTGVAVTGAPSAEQALGATGTALAGTGNAGSVLPPF